MSSAVLARLRDAGVRLLIDGEDLVVRAPAPLSGEQLAFLRARKAEIVAELCATKRVPSDTDALRARLLRDLEADANQVRAVEVIDSDSDPVRLIVAIRGVGTCELLVSRNSWDPLQFLGLVESGSEAVS